MFVLVLKTEAFKDSRQFTDHATYLAGATKSHLNEERSLPLG